MPIDPAAALESLGARWSPDFDAYASGQLPAERVRCVLCGKCPCECQRCTVIYRSWRARAAGEPGEPCGMTFMDGACPRGHGPGREDTHQ